jgi:hypothetical protein
MARAKKVPCKGGGKIAFRAGPRTTTVKCHDCGDQQEVKKEIRADGTRVFVIKEHLRSQVLHAGIKPDKPVRPRVLGRRK